MSTPIADVIDLEIQPLREAAERYMAAVKAWIVNRPDSMVNCSTLEHENELEHASKVLRTALAGESVAPRNDGLFGWRAKIYAASKTKHAQMWRQLRLKHHIVSTWIDEAGEGQTASRSELAARCVQEVSKCDFLLCYCERDEVQKGALIEVGIALALNKEIRFVGYPSQVSTVFAEHPLWRNFNTIREALSTALEMEGK